MEESVIIDFATSGSAVCSVVFFPPRWELGSSCAACGDKCYLWKERAKPSEVRSCQIQNS